MMSKIQIKTQASFYLFLLQNFYLWLIPLRKREEIKKTFTAYTEFLYIRSYWWPFSVFVVTCFIQWNDGHFLINHRMEFGATSFVNKIITWLLSLWKHEEKKKTNCFVVMNCIQLEHRFIHRNFWKDWIENRSWEVFFIYFTLTAIVMCSFEFLSTHILGICSKVVLNIFIIELNCYSIFSHCSSVYWMNN